MPEDAPPAIPVNLEVTGFTADTVTVTWDKSDDTAISSYNIGIYQGDQEITKATLTSTQTTYTFSDLQAETLYTIKLTAANNKGGVSAPAEVEQQTAAAPSTPLWQLIVALIIIAALLGGGTWWIIRNHKKSRKALA